MPRWRKRSASIARHRWHSPRPDRNLDRCSWRLHHNAPRDGRKKRNPPRYGFPSHFVLLRWSVKLTRSNMPTNPPLHRKLRMGLVGGGQGAFIGRVHATAAILDNRAILVAGALSADPAKAKASAPDYDIPPDRAYGSVPEMIAAEARLPLGERVDFVSVATPNHTHF